MIPKLIENFDTERVFQIELREREQKRGGSDGDASVSETEAVPEEASGADSVPAAQAAG